jgi:hypothetical protein
MGTLKYGSSRPTNSGGNKMIKCYIEVIKRGNITYRLLASELDDCNMLFPMSTPLDECKEVYAKYHGFSLGSFIFVEVE